MAVLRRFAGGLRAFLRRQHDARELNDELHAYLDAAIEQKVSGGMSPDAARRAARLEMGSIAAARDNVFDAGWESHLENLWRVFDTLRVVPVVGRLLDASDGAPGSGPERPVAVIGHAFWQRRFGGDPGVVGKPIVIEGVPCCTAGRGRTRYCGDVVYAGRHTMLDMSRLLIACVTTGVLLATAILGGGQEPRPAASMSFFVTSVGRGFGGNLGGLAGADAHCRQLAAAAGQGARTWRAYLSAPASAGAPPVHARDRIGTGPWFNAAGVQVASSVADLHGAESPLAAGTSLTEKGTRVAPGRHDILTGSNRDGTLATGARDTTCLGWTSHTEGRAMLGHHNRTGGGQDPSSWNSAHMSRGCSQLALRASLGDGLFYCFAAD